MDTINLEDIDDNVLEARIELATRLREAALVGGTSSGTGVEEMNPDVKRDVKPGMDYEAMRKDLDRLVAKFEAREREMKREREKKEELAKKEKRRQKKLAAKAKEEKKKREIEQLMRDVEARLALVLATSNLPSVEVTGPHRELQNVSGVSSSTSVVRPAASASRL